MICINREICQKLADVAASFGGKSRVSRLSLLRGKIGYSG